MPLPSVNNHGALQCKAKAKGSGVQCQNPAAYGMRVCRMHGARKAYTVLKGMAHPNYKNGLETQKSKESRSEGHAELRRLESMMHDLGMTTAKRMPGRKPSAIAKMK